MSSITPASIYRAIFAGQTVAVSCPKDKFQSLRVAVQKQHTTPRALDLTSDVVKASYNAEKAIATFKLGPKRSVGAFTIIEIVDDTQV